jgi:hypothetical protein
MSICERWGQLRLDIEEEEVSGMPNKATRLMSNKSSEELLQHLLPRVKSGNRIKNVISAWNYGCLIKGDDDSWPGLWMTEADRDS